MTKLSKAQRALLTQAAEDEAGAIEPPAPPTPAIAAPSVSPEAKPPRGKIATLIGLLSRPEGAGVEAMMAATGWQAHSVRGAISGSIKKTLGLTVISEKTDGVRVYRIDATGAA